MMGKVLEVLTNNGIDKDVAIICSKIIDEYFDKKEAAMNRLINSEKVKCDDMYEKTKKIMFNNIAQLQAVKMLFDLMTTGSTHRQKEQFCNQSKKVIDMQIDKIETEMHYLTNSSDMPF